jgi:hypothetical protein
MYVYTNEQLVSFRKCFGLLYLGFARERVKTPVVIYGSETWVLKEAIIKKFMIF